MSPCPYEQDYMAEMLRDSHNEAAWRNNVRVLGRALDEKMGNHRKPHWRTAKNSRIRKR